MPSRYGPEYASVEQLDEWRARLTGKLVRYHPVYGAHIGVIEKVVPWVEWYDESLGRERTEAPWTEDRLVMVLRYADDTRNSFWVRPDEITIWGED